MSVWWLAIDLEYTSYDELKHRKVAAQGWPELGNLMTLCPLVGSGHKDPFMGTVAVLERIGHGHSGHANRVMWDLLKIRAGDLVVGIEGTSVKGICQLKKNGWESYHYHYPEAYNYAQTIGFPVEWIDWNPNLFGSPPTTPAQGVQGVAGLQNESQRVTDAWIKYQARRKGV